MEFAPLLLEFLISQANTLEYLKLDLFTDRREHPGIPTDVLFNHFPRMPNLITFVVGNVDAEGTEFPFHKQTVAELIPKLRNLENIPPQDIYNYEEYYANIVELEEAVEEGREDFPTNYPILPNLSVLLKNIRGVEISPDLGAFFPLITELHLDGHIGSLHKIPFCLPRLKHFYHGVDLENYKDYDEIPTFIRLLSGFMTGISPVEYQRTHELEYGHLSKVQFARTRSSIFNLNDLETLDLKFTCHEFMSLCQLDRGILPAIEVLISWGLSRMLHLKKLRFKFEEKVDSGNRLPDSCRTLLKAFENRNNMETDSNGYEDYGWPEEIHVEKNWNFELNLQHHTTEWGQYKFFREDPDVWY